MKPKAQMPEASQASDGPSGDIGFECRIVRIEAGSPVSSSEESLEWEVHYLAVNEGGDPAIVVPTGHLVATKNGSFGQALVLGQLHVRPELLRRTGQSIDHFVPGFAEGMYDLARRSLNMLIAQMDGEDLELPTHSPETTIEAYQPEPADVEQNV
jgi:hypothetical protein